ncbi:hypothetical protein VC279_17860 [Xanthomonas sp. WHRI 10064A]|uniref:hypothetical protein n=1 Tax=unclassified Xanthomonas TaxID=2643310 RepID=UPI002B222233|nr:MULTISPECIES: hypothetical protein [unclassified Xanthomonas]MEA9587310.1 hypothetical protein [Xanthomonas sp. WHRI 10064B]MEA9616502.1 hypothetical protein [Xanthomonas sp. WHRI 10064A]
MRLIFAGRMLALPGTQAASGMRFADAQGNRFREYAGDAPLSLRGGDALKCVHEAATTIG